MRFSRSQAHFAYELKAVARGRDFVAGTLPRSGHLSSPTRRESATDEGMCGVAAIASK